MLMSSNLLKASKLTFCRVDVALCPIGWASSFPLEAGSVKRDIDIRSGGCCSIILVLCTCVLVFLCTCVLRDIILTWTIYPERWVL